MKVPCLILELTLYCWAPTPNPRFLKTESEHTVTPYVYRNRREGTMTYTDFLPRELVLKHPESTQWISMVNKRLEITCISKMQTFIPVMLISPQSKQNWKQK